MFTKFLGIFSTTILFCASQINAQYFDEYGVKLGVSSFQINSHKTIVTQRERTFADFEMNERLVTPTISFWTTVYKGNYWSGQFEFSYISKGGKNTSKFTSLNGEESTYISTISYDYLQFVPSIKFFPNLEPLNPYFTIGIPLNYEIGIQNEEISKGEKYLFSYQVGIGSELIMNNSNKYFIEIKYSIDAKNFYTLKFRDYSKSTSDFNVEKRHEGYILVFGFRL